MYGRLYGKKKKSDFVLTKALSPLFARLFRTRNVIIISEHKVDHVPLSGSVQVLVVIACLGFFSALSYVVGCYMTARSSIQDRDRKIVTATLEKNQISEEMSLIRRDMSRLRQNGQELSDYTKFILDQHARTDAEQPDTASLSSSSSSLIGQSNEKLLERVSYLEGRVDKIKEENDRLVTAIRERTDKKINYLNDIIAMTGLDPEHLEQMAEAQHNQLYSAAASSPDVAASSYSEPEKLSPAAGGKDMGGPFIPYNDAAFNDTDRELLENVDRLVLLHDIVEQLPLATPINDAHEASPFGRRLDPINGRWAMHPGVDLAGPFGAAIYSTSAGRVIYADHRVGYGNVVDIDHGFGIVTRYAHMSRILVHEGQVVTKHQQIGMEGSTGRSTGPHLHYEVRINDHPVNPVNFLHAGGQYVLKN